MARSNVLLAMDAWALLLLGGAAAIWMAMATAMLYVLRARVRA
jgi:hypothetical protein